MARHSLTKRKYKKGGTKSKSRSGLGQGLVQDQDLNHVPGLGQGLVQDQGLNHVPDRRLNSRSRSKPKIDPYSKK